MGEIKLEDLTKDDKPNFAFIDSQVELLKNILYSAESYEQKTKQCEGILKAVASSCTDISSIFYLSSRIVYLFAQYRRYCANPQPLFNKGGKL